MMLPQLFRSQRKPLPLSGVILVVSDDAETAADLSECLLTKGYHVVMTTTSAEALQTMEQGNMPDMIFGDFIDPETDAATLLQTARIRLGRSNLPPVVLLMDTPEDAITAERMGVDDLLPKPVDSDQLDLCLSKFVRPTPMVTPKQRPPRRRFAWLRA